MIGEWVRFAAVLAVWTPSLLLLYRVEVLEERRAAEGWEGLFTAGSLSYRITLVDASGAVKDLGVLRHEVVVEGDRALLYTGLRSPGEVSVNTEVVISREEGFLSASGRADILGRRFTVEASRNGGIVELRIGHTGGTEQRRLPVGVLSPESASGVAMLVPFRDVGDFYPGKQWEVFVLDLEASRVRPAVASVAPAPARVHYRGKVVPAFYARLLGLNDYEGWYLRDGRVLRQTIPIGANRLVLERELDDE